MNPRNCFSCRASLIADFCNKICQKPTYRFTWQHYVAAAPQPAVMVIEDLDDEVGYGAFWGEVQSNVHKALGCLGVVTNGSIRDIPMIAPGFQMLAGSIVPSHAYVRLVDFGIDVNIHGMAVKGGDLIHADRHGAVTVPVDKIAEMMKAADGLAAREAKIINAARAPGASVETIKAAIKDRLAFKLRPNRTKSLAQDGSKQHRASRQQMIVRCALSPVMYFYSGC